MKRMDFYQLPNIINIVAACITLHSKNGSRKCFWKIKRKVEMSNEEDGFLPTSKHYKYCCCMHYST